MALLGLGGRGSLIDAQKMNGRSSVQRLAYKGPSILMGVKQGVAGAKEDLAFFGVIFVFVCFDEFLEVFPEFFCYLYFHVLF